jgi:hypothetical protein
MPTRPDPEDVDREEMEAVLETRRELGASYEPALVDSFAEKIERAIDARVSERTGGRGIQRPADAKAHQQAGQRQMILGFVSLGTGIPISAIAGSAGDLPGLIVAWAGIVGINVAHAWQNRRG